MITFKKTLLMSCLISANFGFSQIQESYLTSGYDMNHYSIQNLPSSQFLVAGTLIDQTTQHSDMHILRLNSNGAVMWEATIDNTDHDEILDVTYDFGKDVIAVTGFICPFGINKPETYVALIDASGGNIIEEKSFPNSPASAGTNIIFSQTYDHFYVGGFNAASLGTSTLTANKAFLYKLDYSLNLIESQEIYTSSEAHSSINDITEVDNGLFITGAIGNDASNGEQGVLAILVDENLQLTADVSFENTNVYHNGVSSVYDQGQDELYLISNNSISHNPEVTVFGDILSGQPTVVNGYRLNIDPTWAMVNVSAYQLVPSNQSNNNLVVSGYFNHSVTNGNPDNSLAWVVEFDKSNGNHVNSLVWNAPSAHYNQLGYDVFQNFGAVHSYIYNPEILVQHPANGSYLFIAPRETGSNFGIDVKETVFYTSVPCETQLTNYSTQSINWEFIPITIDPVNPSISAQSSMINFPQTSHWSPCQEGGHEEHEKGKSKIQSSASTTGFSVYPNPTSDIVNIQIEKMNGELKVTNTLGQTLYSTSRFAQENMSETINTSDFKSGIYIVKYVQIDGTSISKKFVKL